MKIANIRAREVLDSRGNPTVEVDVITESGSLGRAIAPSGASTGKKEALEKRDGDNKRYNGKGVLGAVNSVNTVIASAISGKLVTQQKELDQLLIELDGTENKSNLGANALVATSLAIAKAAANATSQPLFLYLNSQANLMPVPLINIVNGGAHSNNALDIQEFMIMPVAAANMSDAIRMGAEVFHALKSLLIKAGYSTNVGDEGGFAPDFESSRKALDHILNAIDLAGYKAGRDVFLALDCAASEFHDEHKYNLKGEGLSLTSEQLINYYDNLLNNYPIYSIEDGLAEDDHAGWVAMTQSLGRKVQLVGDDLFVTNPQILKAGIKNKMANAILIKPNQIGTLTETLETIAIAKAAGYKTVMSHRSGESEDITIAHLAVAAGCGQIKTGSMCRADRTAKYNELIRIAEILGNKAIFANLKN